MPLGNVDVYGDAISAEVAEVINGHWTGEHVKIRFPPLTSCSRRSNNAYFVYVVGYPSEKPGWLNALEFRFRDLEGHTVGADDTDVFELNDD